MIDGQINFDELKKMWDSAADDHTNQPSSGMMTKGTLRYIVSRFPEKELRPSVKEVVDNPAFSDDVVIEFFGENMWVIE
jgi:hypothetical protein